VRAIGAQDYKLAQRPHNDAPKAPEMAAGVASCSFSLWHFFLWDCSGRTSEEQFYESGVVIQPTKDPSPNTKRSKQLTRVKTLPKVVVVEIRRFHQLLGKLASGQSSWCDDDFSPIVPCQF